MISYNHAIHYCNSNIGRFTAVHKLHIFIVIGTLIYVICAYTCEIDRGDRVEEACMRKVLQLLSM